VTTIHEGSYADSTPHTVIPLNSSTAVVGDTIHDSVLITGDVLGSGTAPDPSSDPEVDGTDVVFNLYDSLECVGDPIFTSTISLTGNNDGTASAESGDWVLDRTGEHGWQASWDGDENYPGGAISDCEPFNVIQPLLTIRKEILSCDDDGGKFAVSVDDTDISALLGDPTVALLTDGDTEGPNGLAPDTYTVREVVQDDYVAVYEDVLTDCANTATGVQSITLAGTDDKTCTFLNVRKPRVTVIKEIDGTAGTFDLLVAGDKVNTTDPLQGSTLIHTLLVDNFGTPTVSEVATGDTSLADYSTIIQCDDGTSAAWDLTESPDERSVTLKTLQPGDHVTCTITNISPDLGKACLSD
jgi:hypothetical protein